MSTAATVADSRENEDPRKAGAKRIWYLILAVLLMCMISGVQYSWTLYARPMQGVLGVSLAAVQVSFTLSQVIQSVSQPGGGYFVDRLGPKLPAMVGGFMVGAGWFAMGFATNLPMLYCIPCLALALVSFTVSQLIRLTAGSLTVVVWLPALLLPVMVWAFCLSSR